MKEMSLKASQYQLSFKHHHHHHHHQLVLLEVQLNVPVNVWVTTT